MKGVSPVIATVLMAAITIAVAVVAYSWFMSMQASVQAEASRGAGTIGKERITVDGFRCADNNVLEIYVRNGGTGEFSGNLTVIVRDASRDRIIHREDVSVTVPSGGTTTLTTSPIAELNNCRVQGSGSNQITVELITPVGAVVSRTENI